MMNLTVKTRKTVPCLRKSFVWAVIVAFMAFFATAPVIPARAAMIGVNFQGDAPTPMGPSEVAGVEPQAYWNNTGAGGGNGTVPSMLMGDGTVAMRSGTNTTLTYASTGSAYQTGIADTPGDNRMMRGSLKIYHSPGDTIKVTVNNLPEDFAGPSWAHYKVYAYFDLPAYNTWVTQEFKLTSPDGSVTYGTIYSTEDTNVHYSGTYIEATGEPLGGGEYVRGNYVLFDNLTAPDFMLTVTTIAKGDGSPLRGALNGIQIVQVIPEPASLVLLVLAAGVVLTSRRR